MKKVIILIVFTVVLSIGAELFFSAKSHFSNMGNPGTFKQGYVAEDLSFDSLLEHKKSSLKLVDTKEGFGKSKIGQTKIGGKPDLPKDSKWPTWNGKPLSFLAQIDLAEIKDLLQMQNVNPR